MYNDIPKYNYEHYIRTNKQGGGVSLLINKIIAYSIRKDLMYNSAQYEAVFMETKGSTFGLSKPIIIGIIYRPPNSPIKEFNKDIEI